MGSWDDEEMPFCPVCGAETNDFFVSDYGAEILGCPECVRKIDAWERRSEDELGAKIDHQYELWKEKQLGF